MGSHCPMGSETPGREEVLNIPDSSPPPFINLAPRDVGEEPKAEDNVQNVGFLTVHSFLALPQAQLALEGLWVDLFCSQLPPCPCLCSTSTEVSFPHWPKHPMGEGQSWLPSSQQEVPRLAGWLPPHLQFLPPRILNKESVHSRTLITISIPPFSSRCAAITIAGEKIERNFRICSPKIFKLVNQGAYYCFSSPTPNSYPWR